MKESIICRIFGANGDIGILDRINEQLINEANNKTMESILKTENMNFGLAIEALNKGFKIKVPEWKGYWFKESGIVKVKTAEGEVLETPHFQQYIFREDWTVIE